MAARLPATTCAGRGIDVAVTVTERPVERVAEQIEEQSWIDSVAVPLQRPIFAFLERRPDLRTLLDGTWLGHPVHPAITDLAVGSWAAGFVLDLLDLVGINRGLRRGTDALQAIGLVGALGSAVTGISDWSYTGGGARRLGFVHGVVNTAIAGLYAASLVARARGNRTRGIALSSLGYGMLLFSSWLGGELSYRCGIGVNHTAFQAGPREFVPVLADAALGEGQRRRVVAAGMPVLLVRYQGRVYAHGETCPHLGGPLSEGPMLDGTIVCPWHGSRFQVVDGQVVAGPATVSLPRFDVHVREGQIEVRRVDPGCA
jgi:nitrite reductase/ring-hydroxylating ferredoxin subunit/uncharacterized membrane protein